MPKKTVPLTPKGISFFEWRRLQANKYRLLMEAYKRRSPCQHRG